MGEDAFDEPCFVDENGLDDDPNLPLATEETDHGNSMMNTGCPTKFNMNQICKASKSSIAQTTQVLRCPTLEGMEQHHVHPFNLLPLTLS
jgi:hypothetical protein